MGGGRAGFTSGNSGGPLSSRHLPTLALAAQTYDVQGSLQDSQVTVSIILENHGRSLLKGMELNVLDSLNARMARPEGCSVHAGVPVPFQLPPGQPRRGLSWAGQARPRQAAAPPTLPPPGRARP